MELKMRIELYHNAILKQTVTEAFEREVRDGLIPKLSAIFGDRLRGVQMYEDYLEDKFQKDGYCYYPMTAILDEGYSVVWVKWSISSVADFRGGVPYSFVGQSLDFIIADDTPEEFREVLSHRASYFEGGYVKLNITTSAKSVTFLSGKFSQSFIDELTRQITGEISKNMGLVGLADSTIELEMHFTPESFMEHTSDNVTYRRLLMSAKGCAPRDFWIKWRGRNGEAYSTRDAVSSADIEFSLGEDVPHKAREKEYRYLVSGNSDKYRTAMGKKNITEWRELIKRAIKRGELTRCASDSDLSAHSEEISDKVAAILERYNIGTPDVAEQSAAPKDDIASLAMEKLMGYQSRQQTQDGYSAPIRESAPEEDFVLPDVPSFDTPDTPSFEYNATPTEQAAYEPPTEVPVASVTITKPDYTDRTVAQTAYEVPTVSAPSGMPDIPTEIKTHSPAVQPTVTPTVVNGASEAILRQRLGEETALRAELEGELKKSRAECEELRARVDNLTNALRICEENLKREIEARALEEVKLKEQIELEAKERAREKELFAEAARRQKEETERLIREQEEAEARRLTEEARREAERLEREEKERIEREREAEIRRIEGEARAREAEQDSALTRAQEIQKQMELAARERMQAFGYTAPVADTAPTAPVAPVSAPQSPVAPAVPEPASVVEPVREVVPISPANHPYTSFNARLIFCHDVDPNVTGRIKEILSLGLEYYKMSHVYIKLRARITEPAVVTLEFQAFPEGEDELLKGLISLIGNADLGIMKVIVEKPSLS